MSRRDQGLAVIAAKVVSDISPFSSEIRTRLVSLPNLLHRSGLAATLAFVESKSGPGEGLPTAYRKVRDMLGDRIRASHVDGATRFTSLTDRDSITWLQDLRPADYSRISSEVADVMLWVKRLSEARRVTEEQVP